MIPRKHKTLIPDLAEELDVKPSLIEDFIDFYYKEVKSTMAGFKHTHINLDNLGVIRTRPVTMVERLKKYKTQHATFDPETMKGFKIRSDLEKKIEKIEYNLKEWDEEFKRKKEVRESRYGTDQPLEEQK